jgi:hypothetical protein
MDQQRPPTLFISHPSTKVDTALHIEKVLNLRGVRCWIAPRDIEPGEQWDIAIRQAIGETDAILVLFCADSERSKQVKRELILADNANKSIIPMRLERLEPHELSYHLADSQWIDWIEQRDDAIDRIAAAAREFQAQRLHSEGEAADRSVPTSMPISDLSANRYGAFDSSVGPTSVPYPPYHQPAGLEPARDRTRTWLWAGIGGVLAVAAIVVIMLLATRSSAQQLTEEWFAGTWSDTRDCRIMYRFDRGGSVTDPNGDQGRWFVEEGNMLVVEGLAGTERRKLEIIAEDHVTGFDGNAYRCLEAT